MGKEKKKYETGASTLYMSRNQALRKLKLSLADFRRLCILKGIYPHEPPKRRKAAKGNSAIHTFYYVKDIKFISHDPLIRTFRSFKIFMRRIQKAKDKRIYDAIERIKSNKPKYELDHIVKERYPTFMDALRDLDDCLTLCFLFATFPKTRVYTEIIQLCRRLTVEFMHFVIASRSLTKVFVSIKGIYYQAVIMGQQITWIVPHSRGFKEPSDIDFRIMETFVQFYTTFLGFVNFRLYSSLNLFYPPKLDIEVSETADDLQHKCMDWEIHEEMLNALVSSLSSTEHEPQDENLEFPSVPGENENEAFANALRDQESEKKRRALFEGLKFFLNREVPREELTFMIRSLGGQASWDKTMYVGATYDEDDESITHQIVDRPSIPQQRLSRHYVQPQWIFDSINAGQLLPVGKYFMGAVLPPHLSPFVSESADDYNPRQRQMDFDQSLISEDADKDANQLDEKPVTVKTADTERNLSLETGVLRKKNKSKKLKIIPEPEAGLPEEKPTMRKMKVTESKVKREVSSAFKDSLEEKKLSEFMIPKKKRRLYQKIMTARRKKAQEVNLLHKKRDEYERAKIRLEKIKKSDDK